MIKNSKIRVPMEAHTPKGKIGVGNYYGTGVKQKIGRVREDSIGMKPVGKKGLQKPPTKLA